MNIEAATTMRLIGDTFDPGIQDLVWTGEKSAKSFSDETAHSTTLPMKTKMPTMASGSAEMGACGHCSLQSRSMMSGAW